MKDKDGGLAVLDNECDTASKTWGAILAARAAIAKAEAKP